MRNPFRIRASQRSVSDEQFVRLFGPGALDVVDDKEDPFSGLVFFRSAPGGGKTTLLRMMLPRPLELAVSLREDQQVKPTFDVLNNLGAVDENGAKLLGAMISFSTEYQDLAQFDRGNGLFRSLLDSRIVIATLRSLLDQSGRLYPDDLNTLRVTWEPESGATVPASASGTELFEWASEIERNFYDTMDDLGEPDELQGGHTRLDSLKWFARARMYDGRGEVRSRRILLFDELQFLDNTQRKSLINLVTNAREPCGIWIAERLDAMSHQDLLTEGALEKRDYDSVIQLETQWSGKRSSGFTRFAEQIANLRASKADGFEGREFFPLVANEEELAEGDNRYGEKSSEIETRLVQKTAGDSRYEEWIAAARKDRKDAISSAIKWRSTEILIERDLRRSQASFAFDILPADELDEKEKVVSRAAEHFLRTEMETPLYFGKDTLAAVASSNIDQYLEIAGALFEEISAKITGPRSIPRSLSAERQDAIIREVAELRWEGLVRRLPQGYDAKRFLEALGKYCRDQTFRPTAPYMPGVTGFAISMQDRNTLANEDERKIKHFLQLRNVVTSLVAHNLITPHLDRKAKGKSYMVFYLNRLLCVKFGLPLGYGGWREQSLGTLHRWMELGDIGEQSEREPKLV